jgi:hypothetical protein
VSEAGAPLTRFDFASGLQRGSHLSLHEHCLVHRGDSHLETVPLAAIASVRVEFERDPHKLGWGVTLFVLALVLFILSGPLSGLAAAAAEELSSGTQGVAKALHGMFRALEVLAGALPVVAVAVVLGGAALCVLGWLGSTTFAITIPGYERTFAVRGRNAQLLDFTEAVCERVTALQK